MAILGKMMLDTPLFEYFLSICLYLILSIVYVCLDIMYNIINNNVTMYNIICILFNDNNNIGSVHTYECNIIPNAQDRILDFVCKPLINCKLI